MNKRYRGYLIRFTLLHVLTYTVIGIIFFQLQDYESAFEVQAQFKLYRPLNHPLVRGSMLIQILRGGILATLIYPFYDIFMKQRQGWLLLFTILFGLTVLGSMAMIPDFIAGINETSIFQVVLEQVIGLPEITVQILLFSWLFMKWEKKSNR
ncbi:MAG: hypothetical protein ACOC5A_06130 [Halanaerobiales bacterium]